MRGTGVTKQICLNNALNGDGSLLRCIVASLARRVGSLNYEYQPRPGVGSAHLKLGKSVFEPAREIMQFNSLFQNPYFTSEMGKKEYWCNHLDDVV